MKLNRVAEFEDEKIKEYWIPGVDNPCKCGGNVFYKENDELEKVTYGVCTACGEDVYTYKTY